MSKDNWFLLRIVFAFFYVTVIILFAFWVLLGKHTDIEILLLLLIALLVYTGGLVYLWRSHKKKQIK